MTKPLPKFAQLSCCAPEQAAELVNIGVRPISFFKYPSLEKYSWAEPFTDIGYKNGASECFEDRSLPAFTLAELNLIPRFSTLYLSSATEMADAIISYLSKRSNRELLRLLNESLSELLPNPK